MSVLKWASVGVLGFAWSASGAQFVTSVDSYTSGTGVTLTTSSAAIGIPAPIVGGSNILSPFSPHYEADQIVGIGIGGQLTLKYNAPVNVIAGSEIGVFTNAGINDNNYADADGQATSPAESFVGSFYGAERTAVVEVSLDGTNYVSLGRSKFDVAHNHFLNATTAYDAIAPASPQVADYGKPSSVTLSQLSGKTFQEIVGLFEGSAGGSWIDVPDNLGLEAFQYVRFSDPLWQSQSGLSATISPFGDPISANFFIDAVSANTAAIPEPTSMAVFAGAAAVMMRRRR